MAAAHLHWINATDRPDAFPDICAAMSEPNGLLAAGGDLSEPRLLAAYSQGIFPWFDDGQPVLWWSPDPRCVIVPGDFHASRRLRRSLRRRDFTISFNTSFDEVIAACALPREGQDGTWITSDMSAAYRHLHRRGWAHSVEVWRNDLLVGGLYGLAIGKVFFGESMFSTSNDASKAAMLELCRVLEAAGFVLLDGQVASPHLLSLGATLMPRSEFKAVLRTECKEAIRFTDWPEGRNTLWVP